MPPVILQLVQVRDPPGAVADPVAVNAQAVEQGQEQVGHRRAVRVPQVAPTAQRAVSTAGHQRRQVVVGVRVGIAQAAAVDDHRVVEQRSVLVLRVPQLAEEVGQHRHVVAVDHLQPRHLLRVVLVVRQAVVGVGDADGAVGPVAPLAAVHQRDHARQVGLERDGDEVRHEPDVLLEGRRDAVGAVEHRQVDAVVARVSDTPLHLAHRVEIVAQLAAVARAQRRAQPRGVVEHEVEQAAVLPRPDGPHRRIGGVAVAEQPREYPARVVLVGQRRGGRAPGDGVAVGAAIAGIAAADHPHVLQPELQRRQRGLAADLLRQDLIDRHAVAYVGAARLLRVHAGQPARAGAGMVAGAVA